MRITPILKGVSAALVAACPLLAQEAKSAEEELFALLNTPVTVASKMASTIREQPGIVSLVTRQEIQASGARDLIDILHLVPGFSFGKDVQGVVGAGIRGLWGYEGKVLLLVDGMELNDPLYGTSLFGGHINADIIQRVEIIRGPGSAIYGGNAELAVINVVTRGVSDMASGYVAQSLGRIEGTSGRRSSALAIGGVFENGKFSLSMATGQAPRSNADYQDLNGNTFNLGKQSAIRSTFGSLGVEYFGVQLRALLDSYHVEQREHFGSSIVPNVITQKWDNYYLDLKKSFQLGSTFSLTPSIQFRRQFPWAAEPTRTSLTDPNASFSSNKRVDRVVAGLQGNWDPAKHLNLLTGVEHFTQKAERFFFDGSPTTTLADYKGTAFYAQGQLKTDLVNVTLGARYETHNLFESAFVPRLGLTKVWDKFHMKLLLTKAFRTPAIEGVNIAPGLKPEKTTALELEGGYQITKQSYLVVNLFDTTVNRPIAYFVDANNNYTDAYANFDRMGSRGAEVEYRLKHGLGSLQCSYSYYQNRDTQLPLYQVAKDDQSLLAFPRHKLVLNSTIRLSESWILFGGLVYLGERWAWLYEPNNAEGRLDKLPATPLVNLVLTHRGLHPGLEISLGLYNGLKKEFGFAQAYANWDNATGRVTGFQPPIPAQSQELLLKVAYSF